MSSAPTPVPPGTPNGAAAGRATGAPASAGALIRAVVGVDQALDAPRRDGIPLGNWRWVVRQRATALRDALTTESGTAQDGWLAARGGAAFRERTQLIARAGALGQEVLDTPDVERTRAEIKRLLVDVRRHLASAADPSADRRTD